MFKWFGSGCYKDMCKKWNSDKDSMKRYVHYFKDDLDRLYRYKLFGFFYDKDYGFMSLSGFKWVDKQGWTFPYNDKKPMSSKRIGFRIFNITILINYKKVD